ncbi:MAG: hypothetical protein ACE5KM_18095 [Planctomycetaceae bacterium]
MKRDFETMLLSVKALLDAGVCLVAGTDTPNPWVVPGFMIHKELTHFIDAGLTPYQAIKAATRPSLLTHRTIGEPWPSVIVRTCS